MTDTIQDPRPSAAFAAPAPGLLRDALAESRQRWRPLVTLAVERADGLRKTAPVAPGSVASAALAGLSLSIGIAPYNLRRRQDKASLEKVLAPGPLSFRHGRAAVPAIYPLAVGAQMAGTAPGHDGEGRPLLRQAPYPDTHVCNPGCQDRIGTLKQRAGRAMGGARRAGRTHWRISTEGDT